MLVPKNAPVRDKAPLPLASSCRGGSSGKIPFKATTTSDDGDNDAYYADGALSGDRHCSGGRAPRGAFVVLEGMDRSGKSTQNKLLWKRLMGMGIAVSAMSFPDRTTSTGQLIDAYLKNSSTKLDDRAVHLLFSSNRWEASDAIVQKLMSGTTILCDRYAFSGVAFSSAKTTKDDDDKQVMSMEWCQGPDRGLPAPDCVIFLDLTPEQAQERGGYGEERYETAEMQRRVRERFAALRKMPQNTNVPWKTVNAGRALEEVEAEIWTIVQETLKRVQQYTADKGTAKPIAKLWEEGNYDCDPNDDNSDDDENNENDTST